jgi:hypothetical protein
VIAQSYIKIKKVQVKKNSEGIILEIFLAAGFGSLQTILFLLNNQKIAAI